METKHETSCELLATAHFFRTHWLRPTDAQSLTNRGFWDEFGFGWNCQAQKSCTPDTHKLIIIKDQIQSAQSWAFGIQSVAVPINSLGMHLRHKASVDLRWSQSLPCLWWTYHAYQNRQGGRESRKVKPLRAQYWSPNAIANFFRMPWRRHGR